MVRVKKRNFADLLKAIKSLNYYDEGLFYMDFLWGLHPHFPGFISMVKFLFFFLVSCFYVCLAMMLIITEYNGIETLKKSDILSPTMQVSFILLSYKLSQDVVRALIEKTDLFWEFDENITGIEKPLRWTRYFFVFYKSAILGTTIYYNIVALTNPDVMFPTDCYLFCNVENASCYWFIFFFVDLSAFVLVWGIFTFDGFFAGSVTQVIIQLKLIKHRLESLNFEEDASEENNVKTLVGVIKHHSFVLSFVEDINRLYSNILFTQFSSLIFSMCIGSFLLTLNGRPTIDTLTQYVVYLSCMFSQVFIYSFGGQIIIDESASIADSAYYTNWFLAKVSTQKTVSTIIMRSQQESKISIGGFANLDLRMYLYAAKTAFSFYTMMNQMYQNDLE